jgi:hypothetical protein
MLLLPNLLLLLLLLCGHLRRHHHRWSWRWTLESRDRGAARHLVRIDSVS